MAILAFLTQPLLIPPEGLIPRGLPELNSFRRACLAIFEKYSPIHISWACPEVLDYIKALV
jgi:hypothetical protein